MRVALILALLIFLSFGQAIQFDFINFDDSGYVYNNPHISGGVTWDGIVWSLTHSHGANWHPLTSLSHMIDCQFFGLNPAGHHLINLLLHVVTAIVLFLSFRSMTGRVWRSALVAALFAIHPLRVESVVWIAERKDVLSGMFFVLTLWAYARYVRCAFSWCRYLSVLLFYLLGLLSKPMLVTLPAVLFLLDFWPLNRMSGSGNARVSLRHLILEKLPMVIFALIICLTTIWAQSDALSKIDVSLFYRIANAAVSYVVYLKQMVWPFGLALVYPHPGSDLPVWQAGLAASLLFAISVSVCLFRKKMPWLLTGWFWYLGMLLPVIGLVQVGVQAHADRYTYLPQIGITIMLVWCLEVVPIFQKNRRLWCALLLSVLLAFTLTARRQTAVWRNSMTLWTHTLEHTQKNPTALVGLGTAILEEGNVVEAERLFLEALQIDPYDKEAVYNVGFVRVRQGRLEEGIPFLKQAVRLSPDRFNTHKALGAALILHNQLHEGLLHSRRALELKPDDASIVRNIQIAEARLKMNSQE